MNPGDQSKAPARVRASRRRMLAALGVFVAIGPPIGILVILLVSMISGALSTGVLPDVASDGLFFLLAYALATAYFFGPIPALLAGAAALILCRASRGTAWWIGPASGAVSFVLSMAAVLSFIAYMIGPDDAFRSLTAVTETAKYFAAFVLAALGSWAVARCILAGGQTAVLEAEQ